LDKDVFEIESLYGSQLFASHSCWLPNRSPDFGDVTLKSFLFDCVSVIVYRELFGMAALGLGIDVF
jgi:hypothetical protein